MDKYLVIGKDSCPYCVKAKELLDAAEAPYDYVDRGEFTRGDVAKLELVAGQEFRTVPQIFKLPEDKLEYVGGYNELIKELI